MEFKDLVLLFQLVNQLEAHFKEFEDSYNKQDKNKFENEKKAVLDFQNKINYVLR